MYCNTDSALRRIYTGEYTDDILHRCQVHTHLSGRTVWLMSATDAVPFDPAVPKTEDALPIDDIESNAVLVYNNDTGELLWAGNESKGLANRCQALADAHEATLKAVSNSGQLTRFYVPRNV